MAAVKSTSRLRALGEWLDRRPWIFGAAFLVSLAAALLVALVQLAGVCDSPCRFLPEYPDEVVVGLNAAFGALLFGCAPCLAALMLAAPAGWLVSGRFRRAAVVGLYGLLSAVAGAVLLGCIVAVGCASLVGDSAVDVAYANIARRAAARKAGRAACARTPIPRVRQRRWSLDGGRYSIGLERQNPDRYSLTDARGPGGERVLLWNFASWEEAGGGVNVVAVDGCKWRLDYASGGFVRVAWGRKGEKTDHEDSGYGR